jgi:hypothetical protein
VFVLALNDQSWVDLLLLLAMTMLFPLAVRSLPDFIAETIWKGLFDQNPYALLKLPLVFYDLPADKY